MTDGPLYGRDTVSWRVFQEWVFLFGGVRALLMQLADPKVAAGVAEHSDYRSDPFGRLHRTMDIMWTLALGEPAEAELARRSMEAVHLRVRGTCPDGQPYDAGDPELRWWVYATLVDTVLAFDRRYLGAFGLQGREAYYQESRSLAAAFEIPDDLVSPDLTAFADYVDGRVARLKVSTQAKEVADQILYPVVGRIPDMAYGLVRLIAADLLPERLRLAYGLPYDRRIIWMMRRLGRLVPFFPPSIRRFPLLETATALRRRRAA